MPKGGKRVPTAVKLMRGTFRPGRHSEELQAQAATPRCPAWLSKEARAIWKKKVPGLAALGVLALVDGGALARLCDLTAEYQAAIEPLLKLKLAAEIRHLETLFGLSPSARASLKPAKKAPKPATGAARFFQRGAG